MITTITKEHSTVIVITIVATLLSILMGLDEFDVKMVVGAIASDVLLDCGAILILALLIY
jgi:phage tail tube protein FII